MIIQLFTSSLCPRSRYTEKKLNQILSEYPEISVERIELLNNLPRYFQQKVYMIPTLYVSPEHRLSGFLPGEKQIRLFLEIVTKRNA